MYFPDFSGRIKRLIKVRVSGSILFFYQVIL